MSGHDATKSHANLYWGIFVALLVFTAITVAVSELDVSVPLGILIALVVASIKGYLVAGYFMHLTTEKKIIFAALALTLVLFAVLMILPTAAFLGRHGS